MGEKIIEKTIESQTGGKVDIDTEGKEMKIQTNDGSVSLSGEGNAKLPENFPADIFVFDDAKIVFALAGSPDKTEYSVSYSTAYPVTNALTRYKQEMEKQSWKLENEMNTGPESEAILIFQKEGRQTMITIGSSATDSDSKTSISIVSGKTDQAPNLEPAQE